MTTIGDATEQTYLGNPAALTWALWRRGGPRLERAVCERFAGLGILVELVACGILLTGNEWRRLRPVAVRMDQAICAVCFWSEIAESGFGEMSVGGETRQMAALRSA
mmetsp:Transcript_37706/g.118834  ORF Transcript_37706/g.118834 Transcript_37706/m.118834 type:complete len:107 (+) Transcript_37706:2-322(+)